ncbi:MAG: GWxTD domain-containing protein [Bryobacterales bacterium]|nr:GWxTD domain-containing protein [Bryobacterales bacterium]
MMEAIGVGILQFLWQGLVLLLLWMPLHWAVSSPAARYLLSMAVLGAMVAFFSWTVWSEWSTPPLTGAAGGVLATQAPWLSVLAMIWMSGAGVLAARHALAWMWLLSRIRKACTPIEGEWADAVSRLRERMGVGAVQVMRADWLQSPSVYGVVRPMLLVPASALSGLSPAQIEAVAAHELAHVMRHDFLMNVLQSIAETLLFFHPAVWWMSRQIRADREMCADDLAVRHTGSAGVLAEALLLLEERRAAALMPAASSSPLASRVRRLMDAETQRHSSTGIAIVMLGAVLFAGSAMVYAQPEIPQPYLKWLTEDVVYIIDKAEEAVYRKLTTNEEREMFIVQFWSRRDRTPGTPSENEFKEEHYRRIAYANQRFGSRGGEAVAGWKTDRGRVYIRLGPPDEIERHPDRGTEQWMYRKNEHGVPMILHFQDGVQR